MHIKEDKSNIAAILYSALLNLFRANLTLQPHRLAINLYEVPPFEWTRFFIDVMKMFTRLPSDIPFPRGGLGFFEIDIDKAATGNCFSGRLRGGARKFGGCYGEEPPSGAPHADVNIVLIRAAKSSRVADSTWKNMLKEWCRVAILVRLLLRRAASSEGNKIIAFFISRFQGATHFD
jgi:hypothetical protein